MASMMSPATTSLLANMNRSRVAAAASNNNDDDDDDNTTCTSKVIEEERKRKPLGSIQEKTNAGNYYNATINNNNNFKGIESTTTTMTSSSSTTNNNNPQQQQQSNTPHHRTIGPHETNYTQNYEAYITQTIHRYYESKLQRRSNLGKLHSTSSSTKSYKQMNLQERSDALKSVHDLLERLTKENTDIGSKGIICSGGGVLLLPPSSSSMEDNVETSCLDSQQQQQLKKQQSLSTSHTDNHDINQSFGSATTMGDHDTTNNNNNKNNSRRHHNTTRNKSISSDTTMMEQSMSLLGTTSNNTTIHTTRNSVMDESTTMEQSMSLLGNDNDGRSSSKCKHDDGRKSLESDATTACEQSMSLLGNESHLFSPSGGGVEEDNDDDDEESRFSRGGSMAPPPPAAAIEKVRRYQPNDSNNNDRMMTSPPYTSSYNHKRCASNSGKRGLKSRFRYQDDDNDGGGGFAADDSLFQHFNHGSNNNNDGGGGGGGMFFPSQEDEFSPIQHRFSHDGLELDCGIDGYNDDNSDDDNDDAAGHGNEYGGIFRHENSSNMFSTQQEGGGGGGDDDETSFGCNDGGGFDDDDDDDGGADYGTNNWTQSSRLLTQQQQQSQWSTFKTVDPSTQTNDEDSPVKRRAIRFESTQKGYPRHQRKQREQEVVREDENKIQSMRDELADMAVQDYQVGADQEDDDPIQTVGNLCRRARSCNEEGMDTSLLDEVAPIDVRLRDGHLFHKDPLQCRQVQKKKTSSKAKSKGGKKTVRIAKERWNDRHAASDSEESLSDQEDPSFKDPTSSFPSRVAERLNGAFEFMMKSDGQSTTIHPDDDFDDQNAGLLLSLDLKQTMAVISKLLLTTKKLARSHRNSRNRKIASTPSAANAHPSRGGDYLAGGTLIILRTKEELPTWEAALREFTSLSVFSHNSLQAKDRKNANAAAKCAVYDVVLTTYDLLKNKDATIPVDSIGKAILDSDSKKNVDDGGWLKTRGSETQSGGEAKKTCLQLSILHRMSWYRVLMMDSLGRKGYLTKPDTARFVAAKAVNSLSRFIIFVKEDDDIKMENKFKNDRKQIKSVVQLLHLPSGTSARIFLERWAHDVKSNIKESESSLDSSSCYDDGSMPDDYSGEENESLAEESW